MIHIHDQHKLLLAMHSSTQGELYRLIPILCVMFDALPCVLVCLAPEVCSWQAESLLGVIVRCWYRYAVLDLLFSFVFLRWDPFKGALNGPRLPPYGKVCGVAAQ